MATQFREAPYYENWDSSKGYVRQLALPGRVAQAAEFSNLGYSTLEYMKKLGDSIMKDGNIRSGCSISVSNTDVLITSGTVYLDGMVRDVKQTKLAITGVGEEVIGVKIKESIVTEAEDPDLYDPSIGSENYGQPGVHMLKQEVIYCLNDGDAAPVFRLYEGKVVASPDTGNEFEVINEVLARRTFDESGNYRVNGLEMMDKDVHDDDSMSITLTEGKCYVLGWEINKPVATTFKINRSKDFRTVMGESPMIPRGSSQLAFKLNNHPVKNINRFTIMEEVTDSIVRGSISGGIDYLPKNPVLSIEEIWNDKKKYVRGKDWQKIGDAIDWSLLGEEPNIGTTYSVKYKYNRVLRETENYTLTVDYIKGESKVEIIDCLPVEDSLASIDYSFYMARKDVVGIDRDGNIKVVEGKPDIIEQVEAPIVTDDNFLSIGSVTVMPFQPKCYLLNMSTDTMTMESLQKVVKRVDDMEYNQAVTDLDNEAAEGEPPTELRGIFTDKFIGFTKADVNHKDELGNDTFNAAIDISKQELTLPSVSTISELSPDYDSSIAGIMGDVITAPYSSELVFSQIHATGVMLVNPYAVFDPMVPVKVIPSVDNWIDPSYMTVTNEKVKTVHMQRWWLSRNSAWAESEKKKYQAMGIADGGESLGWKSSNAIEKTYETTKKILDEAIPYIRVRDVTVKASGFEPYTDNIRCLFDDREVALVADKSENKGSLNGTLRADGKGDIKGTFKIPEMVPCGRKSVKIISDKDPSKYPREGSATYEANGRKQHIQKTILKETIIVKPVDPLAQSFQFDEDTVLSEIDLFFCKKDNVAPCAVQVRNVVNGYPGNVSYGEVVLPADNINISEDGSASTRVQFEAPIYCKADTQYCFIVMSDSNEPSLFYAKLGQKDIRSKNTVNKNPYTAGVLFSSSNAITWTAHQDMDLKFNLYKATFKGKGSVLFKNIPISSADRLLIAINALSPVDTGMSWYYKINEDLAWTPIHLFDDKELDKEAKYFALKAEIEATPSRSPMISLENLNLIHFLNQSEGRYISKNVTLKEGYNNIKLLLDVTAITHTDFKVYYTIEKHGYKWKELDKSMAKKVPSDYNDKYVRWEWNESLKSFANNFRVKIELSSTNTISRPRAKRLMCILKTK